MFADQFACGSRVSPPSTTRTGTSWPPRRQTCRPSHVAETEALRGDVRQTFATILQSAAVRLSRAEIKSITDALTGLYNHRYLQERLTDELHRARETEQPLTVLFCDLDHSSANWAWLSLSSSLIGRAVLVQPRPISASEYSNPSTMSMRTGQDGASSVPLGERGMEGEPSPGGPYSVLPAITSNQSFLLAR